MTAHWLNSDFFADCRQRLESALHDALPAPAAANNADNAADTDTVAAAMRYSLLGEAKRFRPLLVYATGHCLHAPPERLTPLAAAVECIHTYSLIHDDLPAMDDAALRRGKPACHRKFGEATAILAGDALQPLAFELLVQLPIPAQTCLKILRTLCQACGWQGLVRGQMLDLAAESAQNTLADMEQIHLLKTARLIEASVITAAWASTAAAAAQQQQPAELTARLLTYASRLGLAFQARDDLLDVVGSEAEGGKDAQADASRGKANCALLAGVQQTGSRIARLRQEAAQALHPIGKQADPLRQLLQAATRLPDGVAGG